MRWKAWGNFWRCHQDLLKPGGMWRESVQWAFSLFSDVPRCVLRIRDGLCLLSLPTSSLGMFSFFARLEEFSVCARSCVWEASTSVMLNPGLKAVPSLRKSDKSTISSLPGFRVKMAKQSCPFPHLPFPMYFLYVFLFVYHVAFSVSSDLSFFSYQHTQLAWGRGATNTPVTCYRLTVITVVYFSPCCPGGQKWQRHTHTLMFHKTVMYVNEHAFTV